MRKYIKWGDKPAGEDTDTLVLTTSGKRFVDIRIYLPASPSEPPLPCSSALPLSRLEWGFAGTSLPSPAVYSSTPGNEHEISKPAHTVWTHWVDNKTTEEVKDEGDMYPQPNGETMEYGSMINPKTGREEKYEECWVDIEAGTVYGEERRRSWVLKTEDQGRGARGMVARIGRYVQAVVRREGEFSVGRWVWSAGQGWEVVVEIGRTALPSGIMAHKVSLGQKFEGADGLEWTCVESVAW
ncbi:hypothetical protein BUE80_DR009293 [Diplocarpon rosae]|nr:hypothetical protein BUE80_DR009293 [Diplocarpon rosae]